MIRWRPGSPTSLGMKSGWRKSGDELFVLATLRGNTSLRPLIDGRHRPSERRLCLKRTFRSLADDDDLTSNQHANVSNHQRQRGKFAISFGPDVLASHELRSLFWSRTPRLAMTPSCSCGTRNESTTPSGQCRFRNISFATIHASRRTTAAFA